MHYFLWLLWSISFILVEPGKTNKETEECVVPSSSHMEPNRRVVATNIACPVMLSGDKDVNVICDHASALLLFWFLTIAFLLTLFH